MRHRMPTFSQKYAGRKLPSFGTREFKIFELVCCFKQFFEFLLHFLNLFYSLLNLIFQTWTLTKYLLCWEILQSWVSQMPSPLGSRTRWAATQVSTRFLLHRNNAENRRNGVADACQTEEAFSEQEIQQMQQDIEALSEFRGENRMGTICKMNCLDCVNDTTVTRAKFLRAKVFLILLRNTIGFVDPRTWRKTKNEEELPLTATG